MELRYPDQGGGNPYSRAKKSSTNTKTSTYRETSMAMERSRIKEMRKTCSYRTMIGEL